jgi:AsmA protein
MSLDRPIHFNFSTRVDGHPLSIDGSVGPLGKALGKGEVPIELSFNVLKQLHGELKGSVTDAVSNPRFDLSIIVSPFSPRKLMEAAGQAFPISTSDPKALARVAFKADMKGNPEHVEVSEGVINIDDTTLNFTLKAGDFAKPDVEFDLNLDEMDLDRYLPPEDGKEDKPKAEADLKKSQQGKKKTDYAPLRRLVLDGTMGIGKLKVANARMKDINLKVTGRNGVFKLEPLSLDLYQGNLTASGTLNVKQDVPVFSMRVQAKDIHSNSLLKDILEKDVLEGNFNADLTLDMIGDDADRIKKSLGGKGILFIKDGAVKGVDLVSMVRNTDGAYGFARKGKESPRTEFSEFQIPLTIKNGIFNTVNTLMTSALLRVKTAGKADLVKDALDLRIEPTFVTTGKEDKDKRKRSEVMIPILVTGSLSSPVFRPDLKGVAAQKLEEKVLESSKFKEIFEKEELKPYEEDVKNLLRGILGTPSSEDRQ